VGFRIRWEKIRSVAPAVGALDSLFILLLPLLEHTIAKRPKVKPPIEACDFDDVCAAAHDNDPSFGKPTMLRLSQRGSSGNLVADRGFR
jgi:hypothetical protein